MTTRRVYFTLAKHPTRGWMRVGKAYASRDAAKECLLLVRGAWRGVQVRVAQCTLRYDAGHLDEKSLRTLDKKFNMDGPNE